MGISFKEVAYRYDNFGKKVESAIENINLKIEKNDEFIFLVGHTGSGKSTLSLHMNALYFPTSGEIDICGTKVTAKRNLKTKYNDIRRKVGLVFQFPEYQLFDETVEKDIAFALRNFKVDEETIKKQVKYTSNLVGLEESLLEKSPFMLSGGQKKRVSIAGILAMNPDILILDEPTSGLDPQGRDEIMELLVNLNNEYHKTIIVIAHDMNLVSKYAKRVICMNKGKIVFDGTKEELFRRSDLQEMNLSLPDSMKIMKDLNAKLGLDLDIYQENPEEVVKTLMGVTE